MRKTLLTALGAAALLSAGAFASQARAMTLASPMRLVLRPPIAGWWKRLPWSAAITAAHASDRVIGYGYGYRRYGWYGRRWYY